MVTGLADVFQKGRSLANASKTRTRVFPPDSDPFSIPRPAAPTTLQAPQMGRGSMARFRRRAVLKEGASLEMESWFCQVRVRRKTRSVSSRRQTETIQISTWTNTHRRTNGRLSRCIWLTTVTKG